ncbi:CD0519/CD1768 family membrane protein [Clostridium hydrogeniformans]|uniref:CD0519/CD1768 family membrane protein n=1 Tax=Clostridium hydrogeniformans TaxID=349933 RepID=UPI0004822E79|nr:membrane protein [Clostridium hydrogeniformans]
MSSTKVKKAIGLEGVLCLILFIAFFTAIGSKMGAVNMINTIMNTAHNLLLNTVFFILAIAVIAGAIASLLSEFGVIAIINKILSPFMKPLYDLPGASALGIITTYLSDNPAIITLADDKGFKRYFKKYQIPSLTNLGTSFGMGLIVTAFMMAQKSPTGENLVFAALIGDLGAVIGSIVSVRIMQTFTKKYFGTEEMAIKSSNPKDDLLDTREIREGSIGGRILSSLLDGGKTGVDLGMKIIPGVLIICTFVLILTNGPSAQGYTGAVGEGVGLLPWIGSKLSFILEPLLGFKNPEAIAFPITSLGAVGAAISLVPSFLSKGIIGGNEIAVFTAMGMCWSGYLSTHVAMMDSLDCRNLTGKAILSHTIGGLCAGISAHLLYVILV